MNQYHDKLNRYSILGFILLLSLALSSCGFKLRGTDFQGINYDRDISVFLGFFADDNLLERQLKTGLGLANIALVKESLESNNHLIVISTELNKQSVGIDDVGRNNEFQFSYAVDFVINNDGNQEKNFSSSSESLIKPEKKSIIIRRNLYIDRNDPIGKRTEERQLVEEMRQEISRKLVRQFISMTNFSEAKKD